MSPFLVLRQLLDARLDGRARSWFQSASREIADGASNARFSALVSTASRHARSGVMLEPTAADRAAAEKAIEGWNVERWTLQEALRVALILSRTDLDGDKGAIAVEELFAYADEGELRAGYRSLALLPDAERFVWRAGEGCRTNIVPVFEAVVLDTPFPTLHFDEARFNQAVVKCVFVGAPLWRMWRIDTRLNDELARMALDLVDERHSAGRAIQPELWICIGDRGGKRGDAAMRRELSASNSHTLGRCAAAFALARAGNRKPLTAMLESEGDARVRSALEQALAGDVPASAFRSLRTDNA